MTECPTNLEGTITNHGRRKGASRKGQQW